jgi:hypothetical protein
MPAAGAAAGGWSAPAVGYWIVVGVVIAYGAAATWFLPRMTRPTATVTVTDVLVSLTFVRLAVAASPGLLTLAISIMAGTGVLYLVAAPVSILLLVFVVYPVDRARRVLEERRRLA